MEYQKKEERFINYRTLLLIMSEVESFHDVVEDEVHFKEDVPRVESSTSPTPITSNDMDVIIKGWEMKFEQISRCLREVQLASEKASSDMFSMIRDGRARESHQERRIKAMYVGITEFLERCDPAHLAASHLCLYPSTGLQDLIGACVRFETHVEIGSRAHKSNEGLYTVQSSNQTELTLEEVMRAAQQTRVHATPVD